jgi:hypothetical protein
VTLRLLVATIVLSSGCSAIFGLEAPQRGVRDDAATFDDDAGESPADAGADDAADGAPVDTQPADAAVDAALQCGVEFVTIGTLQSKYYYENKNVEWNAAEADCEARGAHLVVVGGEAERIAIGNAPGTGTFWIGLTDRATEGTYLWVTDEDTGTYPGTTMPPWDIGQPVAGTSANVTLQQSSGYWQVTGGTIQREYLCECDGYVANPANY